MNNVKTAVIIGIITVGLLATLIWLNRDKFASKENVAVAPSAPAAEV